MLLAERFAARAAQAPDRPAVLDGGAPVSYGALRDRAELAARAVAGHERVALLPRSEADALAVALGAMAAGTSLVLLDRHLSGAQVERALGVAAPALVVAWGRLPPALADRAPARLLRAPGALLAAGAAAGRRRRSARPGDELLVGLTSGTSGEPKLFARDHASWAATLERSDATFDVRPGDLVSTPGPLDHTHFLYGALHALTRGATVDLRPLGDAFAAGRAVTHAYLVPTLAADLAQRLGGGGARGLREALSSAAPWPGPARDRLRAVAPSATVSHFLGASELSFVALDSSREPGPAGSAGRPFAGVELEIRDRQGRPLPDGEVGEVFVRSDMLFSGYLTPRGLRGGPSADGWATVGDLGSVRDGWLTLAGRASDTIVSGGFNVEPAAVERALADLPGVREVACIGLADGRWGAVPAAVLSLEDAAPPPSRAAVRALARERLPQPSRPRRVFVVDALPRSPRGKLRRADLARLVADGGARELGPG